MKQRLDQALVARGLAPTRSQAEHYIRLGHVLVSGRGVTKAGTLVGENDLIRLAAAEQYVSRAGLKLASVAAALGLDFRGKAVLDVGSSTGGFTDYVLQHGARKVIAVDVGTGQLHPALRDDPRVELHEKTDIRDFIPRNAPDIIVADVSFISLREILPHLAAIAALRTELAVMVKPQFEAAISAIKHKGVIKNDRLRREVLHDFEAWVRGRFVIISKADSAVPGAKGNRERFYLLKPAR